MLALAAVLAAGSAVGAQAPQPPITTAKPLSGTQGLVLGIQGNGAALSFEGGDSENGGGGGVMLGIGFTPNLMLFGELDAASIGVKTSGFSEGSNYTLAHFDLGLRFSFPRPTSGVVPWFSVAASGRGVGARVSDRFGTADMVMTGAGFTGGGGVQVHFTRSVALDLGLLVSGGRFTELKVDDEKFEIEDARSSTSARINVGLKFYPTLPGR